MWNNGNALMPPCYVQCISNGLQFNSPTWEKQYATDNFVNFKVNEPIKLETALKSTKIAVLIPFNLIFKFIFGFS